MKTFPLFGQLFRGLRGPSVILRTSMLVLMLALGSFSSHSLAAVTALVSAVSTDEDTTKNFANTDFKFAGAIPPPSQMRITSLPTKGTLFDNGVKITAGLLPRNMPYPGGANTLTYEPDTNDNGADTFNFVLGNPSFLGSVPAAMNITINAVNDQPTISNIADGQSTNEDTPSSAINFTVDEGGGANENSQVIQMSATSSNQAIVRNANIAFTFSDGAGDATGGSIIITPEADATGTVTITVTANDQQASNNTVQDTFTFTVNAVNDEPSFSNSGDPSAHNEDAGAITISGWASSISKGPSDENGQTLTFTETITGGTTGASLFSVAPSVDETSGDLTYTLAGNANGTATVDIVLTDDGGNTAPNDNTSATASITITVNAVNDEPSFSNSGSPSAHNEDAGLVTISGWASSISKGPTNENSQTLTFTETITGGTTGASLFSVAPSVDETSGDLTYTLAGNANGTATVDIVLTDNGGSVAPNDNTSTTASITITVNAINDEPSFSNSGDPSAHNEDAGAITISGWASSISKGPSDENSQTLTFTETITGGTTGASLFSVAPAVDETSGDLTYTLAANANGTATVDIVLTDNGSNTAPNDNTSTTASITITVNAINDEPSFSNSGNPSAHNEDAGSITVSGWASSISKGPSDENSQTLTFTETITGGTTGASLFSVAPAVDETSGDLTYTLAADANGTATVDIVLTDNGGSTAPNDNTSTTASITITVNAVNDEPSFSNSGSPSAHNEDAGLVTISGWASSISKGPANENSQTLTFTETVTGGTTGASLFSVAPAVDETSGDLTYTLAANANGTATVDIVLTDNGSNVAPSDNTSTTASITITVNAINDEPSFSNSGDPSAHNEDAGAITISGWASSISKGPSDENSQTLTFTETITGGTTGASLFSVAPAVDETSGDLTYTLAGNANGTATVDIVLTDNGSNTAPNDNTSTTASITITVNAINDEPSFSNSGDPSAHNEDAGSITISGWASSISKGPSDENSQTLTFTETITGGTTGASLFSVAPAVDETSGDLTYTLAANANGTATVDIVLTDNGGNVAPNDNTSTTASITITVNAVNDEPSFSNSGNPTAHNEDVGAITVSGWASSISKGPSDENGQTLTFTETITGGTTGASLFSVAPAVDETSGDLTYTIAANANGTAIVDIVLTDDGSNTAPNDNTSATASITITVNAINDEPSFSNSGNPSAHNEDAGAITVSGWASSISKGPTNENSQTLTFTETITGGTTGASLFSVAPAVDETSGDLTYTLAADANGTATLDIVLTDDGGGVAPNDNTSATASITITVNAINDEPSFSNSGNPAAHNEDAGAITVSGWASSISKGPSDENSQTLTFTETITGGTTGASLFSVAPAVDETSGDLTYTLAANANGTATVDVVLTDNGSNTAPNDNTSTTASVTITVNAVNDDPVITTSDTGALTETNSGLTDAGTLSVTDVDLPDTVAASVTAISVSGTGDSSRPGSLTDATLQGYMSVDSGNVIDNSSTSGTINWSFNSGSEAFNFLALGETLIMQYTITATDSPSSTTGTNTVTITGTGANDAPVISTSDTGALTENNAGQTDSGTLSVSDSDLTNTVSVAVNSISVSGTGNSSRPGALTDGVLQGYMTVDAGNVIDNANTAGTINWNFNSGTEAFNFLSAGETLVMEYTIRATDSAGATGDNTVTITVTGANDAPVISTSDTGGLTETDAGLTDSGTLSVSDSDVTNTVAPSVNAIAVSGTGNSSRPGSLTDATLQGYMSVDAGNVIDNSSTSGTINWSFDSGTEAFNFLATGETLIMQYTIRATDSPSGGTGDNTVTITVTGTNDSPVIAASDSGALNETDGGISDSGTLSVSDADVTDTVAPSVNAIAVSGTGNSSRPGSLTDATLQGYMSVDAGNVIDNANTSGTINWTWNSGTEAFNFLAAGETLIMQYTIRATDAPGGATGDNTVTITVTGTNDAPVISTSDTGGLTETDAGLTDSGTLSVSDNDVTNTVAPSVNAIAVSGTGNSSRPGSLTDAILQNYMTVDAGNVIDNTSTSGTINWSFNSGTEAFNFLANGETLIMQYTIRATDTPGGATGDNTVTITVTGTNDAPDITTSDTGSLTETDAGLTDSGTLSVSDADVTDTVAPSVTAIAVSGTGNSSRPGSLTDATLQGYLTVDAGNVIDNANTSGTINWSFNSGTEAFNFLGGGQTLIMQYTVTATDSPAGATDTDTVTITVTGTNDAPVISTSDTGGLTETDAGLTDSGTLTVGDSDVTDTVAVSVNAIAVSGTGNSSRPAGLTDATLQGYMSVDAGNVIDNTSTGGTINWSFDSGTEAFNFLANGETLIMQYTIRATDAPSSATGDNTVTITVTGTNDAPVIGGSDTGALSETNAGLTDSGTLSVSDSDVTDTVAPSVTAIAVSGTGNSSRPGSLTDATLQGYLTVDAGNVIDNANTSGTINWSFNSGTEAFNFLGGGETLIMQYTVTATDSPAGATDTDTVTITVTGTNDAPTISTADTGALTETDAGLTDSGTLSVSDTDVTDTVAVSVNAIAVSGTGNSSRPGALTDATLQGYMTVDAGNVIDNTSTSGTINWSFDSGIEAFNFLAAGETLILQYTIRATDAPSSATGDNTVTITITGSNDAPLITTSDTGSLTETDGGLSDSGTLTTTDADVTDTVAVSVNAIAVSGTGNSSRPGSLTDATLQGYMSVDAGNVIDNSSTSGTINWSFNSGSEAFNFLGNGETLIMQYTIRATDSPTGATGDNTVTITVTGTNDAPDITSSDTGALTETDAGLTDTGTLSVSDTDVTDTVAPSVTAIAVSGTGNSSRPGGLTDGTLQGYMSVDAGNVIDNTSTSGTINWSFDSGTEAFNFLAVGETLIMQYTITATDAPGGATDTDTVTITVTGTNDAPAITTSDTGSLTETDGGLTDSGTLSVSDADVTDTVAPSVNAIAVSGTGNSGRPGSLTDAVLQGYMTVDAGNVIANTATTGTINWSFNSGSEAFNFLGNGETLIMQYTIRATDTPPGATGDNTVTITVTGTNDAPDITTSDTGGLTETNAGLTDTGTLSVSDSDVSDTVAPSVTAIAVSGTGDSSRPAGLTNGVLQGYMSVDAGNVIDNSSTSGTINWSFDSGTEAFNFLATGETLIMQYTITATDAPGGATDTGTVTITVTGTNDAPVVTTSDTGSLTETDAGLSDSGTLSVTDSDVTNTVAPSVNAIAVSGTGNSSRPGSLTDGTLQGYMSVDAGNVIDNTSISCTINWTFNSGAEAFNFLAVGETLIMQYTIRATDTPDGATGDNTVTITVTGTNETPVITIGAGSAAEGLTETDSGLTANSTLAATDLDLTDTVATAVDGVVVTGTGVASNPLSNGTIQGYMSVDAGNIIANTATTGTINWSFDSGTEPFNFLNVGETLILTYTISATDAPTGASDTQTVVITITGTNDNPVITSNGGGDNAAIDVAENSTAVTTAVATDVDVTDTRTYSKGGTDGGLFTIDTNTGVLAFAAAPDFETAGDANADNDYVVTVTATDANGGTDTQTITVTVTNVNEAPVVTVPGAQSVNEDASKAFTGVSVADVDADLSTGLTVTLAASNGTISVTASGSANVTANASASVTVSGSVTDVSATIGSLQYTGNSNYHGADTITVTADDGGNTGSGGSLQDVETIAVTVVAVADAPNLSVSNAVTTNEDTAINLGISSSLVDSDASETLSVSIAGLPTGASLTDGTNNSTTATTDVSAWAFGSITVTGNLHDDSDFSLTVTSTATEGSNADSAQTQQTINVTVDGVADQPNVGATANIATNEDVTSGSLGISSSLVDTTNETLTVEILNLPSGGKIQDGGGNTATSTGAAIDVSSWTLGNITVTPPAHDDAEFTLTVRATATEDNHPTSTAVNTATINVTVTAVADLPTLTVDSTINGLEDAVIPLDISASSPDPSESQKFTIVGTPTTFTLSHGTESPDGTWTGIDETMIGFLTLRGDTNRAGTFTLQVSVVSEDNDSSTSATVGPQAITVTIAAIADEPTSSATTPVSGNEDTAIALTLAGSLVDTDGSETLTFQITGMPSTADLSCESNASCNDLGSGVWELAASDFSGLTVTQATHVATDFNLSFVATTTESVGGSNVSVTKPIAVTFNDIADTPNLTVANQTGDEDTVIPLNITSSLVDTDGSEVLTARISGVPTGATLSAGTDLGGGNWDVPAASINSVSLTPAANNNDDFTLSVTLTATESTGGNAAVANGNITVTVNAVNDAPTVGDETFSLDENSPNGTVVGSLTATDIEPVGSEAAQTLAYALTGTAFAIDGNGQITVADVTQLDYETTTSFVLTATVSDNGLPSQQDTATVTINLNPLNDNDPTGNPDDVSVDELQAVNFNVLTNDEDLDEPAATLTVSEVNGNAALVGTPVDISSGGDVVGTLTINSNGAATFVATADNTVEVFSLNATYSMTDGSIVDEDVAVNLTINPINDNNPALTTGGTDLQTNGLSFQEDQYSNGSRYTLILSSLFSDLDIDDDGILDASTSGDNDSLVFSIISNSDSALLSTNLTGNDLELWTAQDGHGDSTVVIRATDTANPVGNIASVDLTFTVTVESQNDQPLYSLGFYSDITQDEDCGDPPPPGTCGVSLDLNAFVDRDLTDATPGDDSLTYTVTLVDKPNAFVTTGVIDETALIGSTSIALDTPAAGQRTITLTTTTTGQNLVLNTDAHGELDVTVRATDQGRPPAAPAAAIPLFDEGSFTLTVNAIGDDSPDAEDDHYDDFPELVIPEDSDAIFFNPTLNDYAGDAPIKVILAGSEFVDSFSQIHRYRSSVRNADPNDEGTLQLVANGEVSCSEPGCQTLETADTSIDASGISDVLIMYKPAANFHGEDSFRYCIQDSMAGSEPAITDVDTDDRCATVTINVTPVNDLPVPQSDIVFVMDQAATLNCDPLECQPTGADPLIFEEGLRTKIRDVDNTHMDGQGCDPLDDTCTSTADTLYFQFKSAVNPPDEGQLLGPFLADGSFTYKPDATFDGEDSFIFHVCDVNDFTDADHCVYDITARIEIAPLEQAPSGATQDVVQFDFDLAEVPLELRVGPEPNVLIVNDDSGSMDWDILTDRSSGIWYFSNNSSIRYLLPATGSPRVGDEISGPGEGLWALRNSNYNTVYYNPEISYEPWKGLTGSPADDYPDSPPTAARNNPRFTPTTNLRVPITYTGRVVTAVVVPDPCPTVCVVPNWFGGGCAVEAVVCPGGTDERNVTVNNYYIPRYYKWDDLDSDDQVDFQPSPCSGTNYNDSNHDDFCKNPLSEGELVLIRPASETGGSDTYPWYPDRTECTTLPGFCTYDEEIQNFANWFTYSRNREFTAKSALGKVVAEAENIRIGYAKLNSNSNVQRIQSMNSSVRVGAKADLLDAIYRTGSSGGTPLRRALRNAGRHFECVANDIFGSSGSSAPGDDACPILESPDGNCQQNFTLLMSDGAWNGGSPSVGDDDDDSNTLFDGGVYAGSTDNTLADVAMQYYERDLHGTLPNEVLTTARDRAGAEVYAFVDASNELMHQHMKTYTVGFGVDGLISDGDVPTNFRTSFDWGNPNTTARKIDDVRHAAVNGRGQYLSAGNSKELADALIAAFEEFASGSGAASAVSFNSQEIQEETLLFRAFYNTKINTGNLLAIPFTEDGLGDESTWEAATVMDGKTYDERVILTMHTGDPTATPDPIAPHGIPFRPDELSETQRAVFITDQSASDAQKNVEVTQRVNYLRGDASNERPEGNFRERPAEAGRLGDIVHSSPIFVGPPNRLGRDGESFPEGDDAYELFRGVHAGNPEASPPVPARRSMLYVSANDGMMHAFDAATGEEVFGYVPNAQITNAFSNNITMLLNFEYQHHFFVDRTPAINDVFIDPDGPGPAGKQWTTILVGGHGAGAKSYFALNITDPDNFTEADADDVVMWEFTEADDAYPTAGNGSELLRVPLTLNDDGVTQRTDLRSPAQPVKDLGYTFTTPTLAMTNVVEDGNFKWAAIAGNGYNSTAGVAKLFLIWLDGPSGDDGQWCHPDMKHNVTINGSVPGYCNAGRQDYIKLDTGFGVINEPGDPLDGYPNGLGIPRAIDIDNNATADYIYAGDYQGNLFRFDVTDANIDNWSVHRLYQASYDPDDDPSTDNEIIQPITTQPIAIHHPSQADGFIVVFTTGSFITVPDGVNEDIQSIYGIWDRLAPEFISRSQLVQNRWINTQGFVEPDEDDPNTFVFAGNDRVRDLRGPAEFGGTAIDYGPDENHKGWHIDLDMVAPGDVEGVDDPEFPGERAIRRLQARGGGIFVNSIITKLEDSCVRQAGGALLALCPEDGLDDCFANSAFDVDNDGDFDEVTTSSKRKITGILIEKDEAPTEGGFIENKLITQVGDDLIIVTTDTGRAPNTGRISWKQLEASLD